MSDCRVISNCEESIFGGTSWRCNDNTTSTTTSTSTTSTTTSSTTTTTTTLAPESFTFINNSQYNDLEYFVFAVGSGTTLLATGFVQSSQTIVRQAYIPSGSTSVTIWVKQFSGDTIYVTTSLVAGADPAIIFSYPLGVTEFQYNGVTDDESTYVLTIADETPITTTTTTSTSTTSTTSTSSTSTTTSSTTTTTTTEARENLIVRVRNMGSPAIGFNTKSINVDGFIQTDYYALTGGALISGGTQTPYNSMVGTGNQTRVIYENTAAREVAGSLYWSNDNGSTYSLVGSFFLIPYSGAGAYPKDDSVYNTPQSTTTGNILEIRVIAY